MATKKIMKFADWRGENKGIDYVETTIDHERTYWFTPKELINAKARWLRSNWNNIIVKLRE